MDQPTPVIQPVSKPKILKPILLGLGIFVFLSSLATAGYLFAQNRELKQQRSLSITPAPQPTLTPIDSTTGWKTHTNEDKYSISYPNNWKIEQMNNYVTHIYLVDNDKGTIGDIYIDSGNSKKITLPITTWIQDYNKELLSATGPGSTAVSIITILNNDNKPSIGGEKTIKASQAGGMTEVTIYYLVHNGTAYSIQTIDTYGLTTEELKQINNQYQQILSTFKFTDPTEAPTPTITIAPTAKPMVNFNFYIDDFSQARSTGTAVGAKITVFNSNNQVVGSGIQPAVPYKPEGGGVAVPSINMSLSTGKYTYKAELNTLAASGDLTISTTGKNSKIVYLYAKPIQINGKFFLDSNNSAKFETGETIFAGKKIMIWYHSTSPDSAYRVGETITNSNGDFSLTLIDKYEGQYIIGAEQVLGYREISQPRFYAKGAIQ